MNKLYIILIIVFIIYIYLSNLCIDLYEGHALVDPHIPHGTCGCTWINLDDGTPRARKCNSRAETNIRTSDYLPSRDSVRDFCREQENRNECHSAVFQGVGAVPGLPIPEGEQGACTWKHSWIRGKQGSIDDVVYHPHSYLDKLMCGPFGDTKCRWISDGTLLPDRVSIPEDMKNNIDINRDDLFESDEFKSFLNEDPDRKLSYFTRKFNYITTGVSGDPLTPDELAFIDNATELERDLFFQQRYIGDPTRIYRNYISILVTGSDESEDIGKIYKLECGDERAISPRCAHDNVYNEIINTNRVVSLGSNYGNDHYNPNYAYGVVLYWEE